MGRGQGVDQAVDAILYGDSSRISTSVDDDFFDMFSASDWARDNPTEFIEYCYRTHKQVLLDYAEKKITEKEKGELFGFTMELDIVSGQTPKLLVHYDKWLRTRNERDPGSNLPSSSTKKSRSTQALITGGIINNLELRNIRDDLVDHLNQKHFVDSEFKASDYPLTR